MEGEKQMDDAVTTVTLVCGQGWTQGWVGQAVSKRDPDENN